MRVVDLSVYLVLDPAMSGEFGPAATARAAVAGGATVVQIRAKSASTAELVALGREVRRALAATPVPLVINDDPDAAVALSADGLHVGQDDIPADEARAIIGIRMALGVSVDTVAQAEAVDPRVVDHVGVGPVFATATKPEARPPLGLDGLARVVAASPVPAVAIGGLAVDHVPAVFRAGARGVAVVSAICGRPDPRAAAHELRHAVQVAREDAREHELRRDVPGGPW
ncbi:MAG: thiamine phosphate synthase [Kineosporiaceae bacterium]